MELAYKAHNTLLFEWLVTEKKIDPTFKNNFPIRMAFGIHCHSSVKTLLQIKDVKYNKCYLKRAFSHNDTEIALLLINDERFTGDVDDGFCLRCAAKNNNIVLVDALLNHEKVKKSGNIERCMEFAAKNGYIFMVEMLLKTEKYNPELTQNYPLYLAALYSRIDVVKMMLENEKVRSIQLTSLELNAIAKKCPEAAKLILKAIPRETIKIELSVDTDENIDRYIEYMKKVQ